MGLISQAIDDIKEITSDLDEWGVVITLTAPDLSTAKLNGLHTKHHLAVDQDGKQVNSRSAHVSFSESNLLASNVDYPLRNSKNEVVLKGHKVSVSDSTGLLRTYIVREWFPDETIGLIVCILGDFV